MHAWYTTFLELQSPPKGHSSLFLQLQDSTSAFLSLVISSLSSLLLYIYIYIYIVIHWQTVSLYHNSSVWLVTYDSWCWDRNPPNFKLDFVSGHLANKRTMSSNGIVWYVATAAAFVYLHFIPYRIPVCSIRSKSFALCKRQPVCVCVCVWERERER